MEQHLVKEQDLCGWITFVAIAGKNIFQIVPSLDGVPLPALMLWMPVFGVEVSLIDVSLDFILVVLQILLVMVQFASLVVHLIMKVVLKYFMASGAQCATTSGI